MDKFKRYDLVQILQNIGGNFYALGDYEKTLDCLLESEKHAERGNPHIRTMMLNTIETEGEIIIRFRQQQKDLVLGVQDNGVGLPSDFDLNKSRSLGMNLVRGLVRQIKGKLDLVSNDTGTAFTIYCLKNVEDTEGGLF